MEDLLAPMRVSAVLSSLTAIRLGRPSRWRSVLAFHSTPETGNLVTMMKLDSLAKLFIHELKDLYSAETQLIEALPKMEKAATDAELKTAFKEHLVETKKQADRLEKILKSLDAKPGGQKCAGMEGLIEEGEHMIDSNADPRVRDAGLIAAAQRVEHYEMAGYGTARAYAEKLGEYDAVKLLTQTLEEEGATDRKLTQLAEHNINFLAFTADKSEPNQSANGAGATKATKKPAKSSK